MSEEAGLTPWKTPPSAAQVAIPPPELRRWLPGNAGIPGVWSFAAERPGPHLAVTAIVHGNEFAGAVVLDRWLQAGLRPARGRLSLIFCNLEAFARFDRNEPTASRYVDEDMNRVWDRSVLDGPCRQSCEWRRARVLRPVIDTVDLLVDLHSMPWTSGSLILAGETAKAARFGMAIGVPPLVVADAGHLGGRRMIDYERFSDPATRATAVLVEAGHHWETATVEQMERAAVQALRHAGMAPPELPGGGAPLPRPRLARVTRTVTARSRSFAFVREFHGGEVIRERNTLIATDGEEEIRTPHDDCLLVMPTPFVHRGHTAVRLAAFVAAGPNAP